MVRTIRGRDAAGSIGEEVVEGVVEAGRNGGQVWCVVSARGEAARDVAGPLLRNGRQVALLAPDVSPFAMLVNEWGDAVLSAEIREPGILSLTDALWQIEENFGAVDVIALIDDSAEPERVQWAADFFAARWPAADLVIVNPMGVGVPERTR